MGVPFEALLPFGVMLAVGRRFDSPDVKVVLTRLPYA